MQITFIGGGNMATAIIGGLVKEGGHQIHVVDPNADRRDALSALSGVTAGEAVPALSADEVVVLAVKPQQLKGVCEALSATLNGALVVSIAAGIRLEALSRWLGGHTRIVRVMPNTPSMVGKGVSGLYADAVVGEADRKAADAIMGATGVTLWLADEEGIDDITSVSGSGPAYVFYFMEGMINAAREVGFSEAEARRLVLATFEGAVALAQSTDTDIAQLRANVTSKGGTTERAIARFDAELVKAAIVQGARDCRARSIELGEQLSRD